MGAYDRFIAFENYRMQVIEVWPDGVREVALNAVRSALAGILRPEGVRFESGHGYSRLLVHPGEWPLG